MLSVLAVLSLLVVPGFAADDPEHLESAAKNQEDAAAIREELLELREAAKLYSEAAALWERAALAYEEASKPDKARFCWKHFKDTAEKAEKLRVTGRLVKMRGDFQEVVVTQGIEYPLQVQLQLQKGVSPEGYQVEFRVVDFPAGSEDFSLEKTTAVCDAAGKAEVFFTSGTRAGTYRIEARATNIRVKPVIFEVQAVPAEAVQLEYVSGGDQIVRTNAKAAKPLEVTVTDLYGNRIIGYPVEFKIVKQPEGAVGTSVSPEKSLTGITKIARAEFSAGDKEGDYVVYAQNDRLDGSPQVFNITVVPSVPRIVVKEIRIQGNKSVHNSIIEDALSMKVGAEYLVSRFRDALSSAVKDVMRLGNFEDVKVESEIEGNVAYVTLTLEEYPRIRKIVFQGNTSIKDDKLYEAITLADGQFANPYRLNKTSQELVDAYREKGYLYVDVEEQVVPVQGDSNVDVRFNVYEGVKVKIKRFTLHGNKAFGSIRLNWEMKTGKGKVFSQEIFDRDRERVLLKYAKKGYIKAQMEDPIITYNEDQTEMYLDVFIDEGKRYKLGDVTFSGNQLFTDQHLQEVLKLDKGKYFNQEKFREALMRVQDAYSEKGHIFARVVPREEFNEEQGIINFVVQIEEGPVAFIEDIVLKGNVKTKDKVIMRELEFKKGEVFNGVKVRESRRNLINLGFFDEVNVRHLPGTKEGYQVVEIEVREGKTGQANFGAGYSSQNGFVGFLQVTKKNFDPKDLWSFTGAGQNLSVSTEFGGQKNSFSFSWSDRFFRDTKYSLSLNGFNTTQEKEGYDVGNSGGSIGVGRQWGKDKDNSIFFSYKFDDVTVDNIVVGEAPSDIIDEAGPDLETKRTVSSLTTRFVRDKRDNFLFTTKGYRLMVSNELAGYVLGGDEDFDEFQIEGRWYKNVVSSHIFAVRGRYAIIGDVFGSDPIPSFRRFFLGGQNTVRGFRDRQIDIKSDTGASLGGGAQMAFVNLEYRIPVVERVFTVVTFLDIGSVWQGFGKGSVTDVAVGGGLGMRITTPLGPIRLDFGRGFTDPNKGNTEVYFGIGESF